MNSIEYRLSPKVGVENGPHTSECTRSKGFVVRLTGTLMNLCLCFAWMQTVHIQSSFVYPPIRVFMAVGFIWASGRFHSLDFRIEGVGGFVDTIVGVSEDSIVSLLGSEISSLESELSLFLFLPFAVVDERSAVTGTMIYIPLVIFAARVQEDGEVMEHFPSRNIVVCPPKSN